MSAEEVDKRTRSGDWEIDLLISKWHSGDLLTIVKRVTLYSVTKPIFINQNNSYRCNN
ncbi:MAG: hypothetical protein KAH18_12785 [Psychromonas sp.]|nr:hypothetical protein [Psychromonas sp.]